ncbi:MAG: AraC family transcriptional regulator [Treponema sp.]|jgi:AraC-like DNA-binding protein|nr:AraC family transcriptional regulator [Treponema sp.]
MKRSFEHNATGLPYPITLNGHELVVHGSPEFRMSAHHTLKPFGSSQVLYRHWHEELEILFFTRGQARFHLGREEFIVKERETVIIQPNALHSADRIDRSPCEFYAVLVHYNFLASLENDDIQQNYILPFFFGHGAYPAHISADMDRQYKLLHVLRAIIDSYKMEEKGYKLFIKSKLYEVFHIISKYAALYPHIIAGKGSRTSNSAWSKEFLQFVQENFGERLTLTRMAEKVNMSEGHLCREVKRVFGMPPVEFLNTYRISRAVHLIETTDRCLGDISDSTGFPNVNRFTSAFKKVFRCTPQRYRMKLRNKLSFCSSDENSGILP